MEKRHRPKKKKRCEAPACKKQATYELDRVPMCTEHAEFYKNDFEKRIKI